MHDPSKYDPGSHRFALELSISNSHYTTRESAALYLLRSMADALDNEPRLLPALGTKYMQMLVTMNLVPVKEVRPPAKQNEEPRNDQQPGSEPESGPATALRQLRVVRGPGTRTA